jgi:hypothetical protein
MPGLPAGQTAAPSGHAGGRTGLPRTTWAAYAACALALLSAVPNFYWALGGTAGLDTVGGTIEELARSRNPAGVALGIGADVLKLAGALLALALLRPWGRLVPRRLLLGAAWAASVVLTAYGGLQVAVGALGVDRGAAARRPGRPHRAAVARPGLGPVVPGLGPPARRGRLAPRSAPRSGGAMNQPGTRLPPVPGSQPTALSEQPRSS